MTKLFKAVMHTSRFQKKFLINALVFHKNIVASLRSSHPGDVLRFANFTGKQLWQSPFLIKLQTYPQLGLYCKENIVSLYLHQENWKKYNILA